MPNYFDTMFREAVDPTLDAAFAEPFGYRRRGVYADGSPILATLSAHPTLYDAVGSIVQTVHTHILALKAALISFGGMVSLPQEGDEITKDLGDGTAEVYEVCKGEKSRCYDPIDGQGYRLVVFSQLTTRKEPSV
jgi:hypothetical protein